MCLLTQFDHKACTLHTTHGYEETWRNNDLRGNYIETPTLVSTFSIYTTFMDTTSNEDRGVLLIHNGFEEVDPIRKTVGLEI